MQLSLKNKNNKSAKFNIFSELLLTEKEKFRRYLEWVVHYIIYHTLTLIQLILHYLY